uniref:Uncharacterized protein n=1 Tax=Manihot esculenta TaxID=3983 RepID=A0A2C9WKI3_MANES
MKLPWHHFLLLVAFIDAPACFDFAQFSLSFTPSSFLKVLAVLEVVVNLCLSSGSFLGGLGFL